MALNNGPYYTSSSKAIVELGSHELPNSHGNIYPEPGPAASPDAQMIALTDDALHAHEENTASHFAGLLQAATAAAGHDGGNRAHRENSNGDRVHRTAENSRDLTHDRQSLSLGTNDQGRKSRACGENATQLRSTRKGKRPSIEHVSTEKSEDVCVDTPLSPPRYQAPISHSASTLFRRPSSTSKKYTRPPMSKLFSSLELSPDTFLQLQSAAKNYMLDNRHPDRRDTVGQRGKGDSELVKLRLWNCVKDFLDGEGNGERFFGLNVPGDESGPRTMFWPSHKNNIVSAVIPLLRRMVTNERQRRYAVETRKPDAASENHCSKKRKFTAEAMVPFSHSVLGSSHVETEVHHFFREINGAHLAEYDSWKASGDFIVSPGIERLRSKLSISPEDFHGLIATVGYHLRVFHGSQYTGGRTCSPECETAVISNILQTEFLAGLIYGNHDRTDPNEKACKMTSVLHELFRDISDSYVDKNMCTNYEGSTKSQDNESDLRGLQSSTEQRSICRAGLSAEHAEQKALMLHLNVLKGDKRILPPLELPVDKHLSYSAMVEQAQEFTGCSMPEQSTFMVWLPKGLTRVSGNAEWKSAIGIAASTDWMDGTMKVLWETDTV
ncbi:hypothetical protein MMC13_006165 [Lambiella insularis]|nr:hypothetical protein [Lambiella insularis]